MHAAGGDRLARLWALGLDAYAGLELDDLNSMGAQEVRHHLALGVEAGTARQGRAGNG